MKRTTAILTFILAAALLSACVQPASFGTSPVIPAGPTATGLPPTVTAIPTVDPLAMSQNQMAAEIETASTDAATASTAAGDFTVQAAADGTITDEEIYTAMTYVYDAEAALAYAEYLLVTYDEYYGEYADDALETLSAIEDDLSTISEDLDTLTSILEQGAETATAALDQLQEAAGNLSDRAAEAQTRIQGFTEQVQAGIDARTQELMNLAPSEIPGSRDEAIEQIYAYLDTVNTALQDSRISPDELANIGQLAANAKAGINANLPALSNLTGQIDGLTGSLGNGGWGGAPGLVSGFEANLPARPHR